MSRHRFAIIGVGMVGQTLAGALAARHIPVAAMAARRPDAVQQAAAEVACPLATTDPAQAAGAADVVVLAVPDDAIAAVCQQIAAGGGFEPGDVALHLSGACPSAILAPAAAAGAACLAFHPIQTFARVDPALFQGIACALEGDASAVAFGEHLARAL
ncbi:NAD(P)-binding domain-containing protein, partial [bacterium]|nr:NAD(P)-binding domain-containing protein [bacterium]